MLGHQADDGLVGVEVDVAVEEKHRRADEHQQHRERAEEPRLAPSAVEDGRAADTVRSIRLCTVGSSSDLRVGRFPPLAARDRCGRVAKLPTRLPRRSPLTEYAQPTDSH